MINNLEDVKKKIEEDMVEYHMLLTANPLDKHYSICEYALIELYKDLFGDEAYGEYLADYHNMIKRKIDNFAKDVCIECNHLYTCDNNWDEKNLINCMLKEPLWDDAQSNMM